MPEKPQKIGREYIEDETPEEIERAKKRTVKYAGDELQKKVKDHHKGRKPST